MFTGYTKTKRSRTQVRSGRWTLHERKTETTGFGVSCPTPFGPCGGAVPSGSRERSFFSHLVKN